MLSDQFMYHVNFLSLFTFFFKFTLSRSFTHLLTPPGRRCGPHSCLSRNPRMRRVETRRDKSSSSIFCLGAQPSEDTLQCHEAGRQDKVILQGGKKIVRCQLNFNGIKSKTNTGASQSDFRLSPGHLPLWKKSKKKQLSPHGAASSVRILLWVLSCTQLSSQNTIYCITINS